MPGSVEKDIPCEVGVIFTATIARPVFCDACLGKCEPPEVRSGSINMTLHAVSRTMRTIVLHGTVILCPTYPRSSQHPDCAIPVTHS